MKKNTGISERISNIVEYLGVSKNEFALKLGYDRSQTIYDITNGKSLPSHDFFDRFLNSEYSENINIEWVISGHGNMLRLNKITADFSAPEENKLKPQSYISVENVAEESVGESIYKEISQQMLKILSDKNTDLAAENALLKQENKKLIAENAVLKHDNQQLRKKLIKHNKNGT